MPGIDRRDASWMVSADDSTLPSTEHLSSLFHSISLFSPRVLRFKQSRGSIKAPQEESEEAPLGRRKSTTHDRSSHFRFSLDTILPSSVFAIAAFASSRPVCANQLSPDNLRFRDLQ